MTEQLILKGTLEGHSGWVTSLATSLENPNCKFPFQTFELPNLQTFNLPNLFQLTDSNTHQCFYPAREISPSSSGTSPATRAPTVTQRDPFTVTLTSFPTAYVFLVDQWAAEVFTETQFRSSPLTVPTLFPPPGTRLSAFGSSLPVPPPVDLLDTPTMFSLSPSPPTTDKSFPDPAIVQSSSGTL